MRVLIVEQSFPVGVAASGGTAFVSSPTLRPRLQGNRGALRADALSSNYVDRAEALLSVFAPAGRGVADLAKLKVELRVVQFPSLGTGFGEAFPALFRDVSGSFLASQGQVLVPLDVNGVCRVEMRLTNLSDGSLSFFCQSQVFGDQRSIDVDLVRFLVGTNVNNPALDHNLDG